MSRPVFFQAACNDGQIQVKGQLVKSQGLEFVVHLSIPGTYQLFGVYYVSERSTGRALPIFDTDRDLLRQRLWVYVRENLDVIKAAVKRYSA
jgi:hypothetical protein